MLLPATPSLHLNLPVPSQASTPSSYVLLPSSLSPCVAGDCVAELLATAVAPAAPASPSPTAGPEAGTPSTAATGAAAAAAGPVTDTAAGQSRGNGAAVGLEEGCSEPNDDEGLAVDAAEGRLNEPNSQEPTDPGASGPNTAAILANAEMALFEPDRREGRVEDPPTALPAAPAVAAPRLVG